MNRFGLEKLIHLYVGRQDQLMNEIYETAAHCPEQLVIVAQQTYEDVKNGNYTDYKLGLKLTQEALSKVEAIIAKYGPEEYPKARRLRDKLLVQQDYYSNRRVS